MNTTDRNRLTAFVVAMAVLIATPLAVVATDAFTDVSTSSVHHDNIAWLKDAGVTSGCNPPDNDEYCPTENVTRAQMATFMRNLATNQVVDAATAVDSEQLGGMTAGEIIDAASEPGEVVMRQSIDTLVANTGGSPSFIGYYIPGTYVSGDGSVKMSLTGPAVFAGESYRLHSLEYCIADISSGIYVNRVRVHPLPTGDPFEDETDRTEAGCYTITAGGVNATAYVFDAQLLGGGSALRFESVQTTWEPTSAP